MEPETQIGRRTRRSQPSNNFLLEELHALSAVLSIFVWLTELWRKTRRFRLGDPRAPAGSAPQPVQSGAICAVWWTPYYPIWSLTSIGLGAFVIDALAASRANRRVCREPLTQHRSGVSRVQLSRFPRGRSVHSRVQSDNVGSRSCQRIRLRLVERDRWRLVPMVGWIRTYDRRWLRGDLIAGVAVAALIVPKNLGYAGIAGIPVQNGLYAAAAGAILYAVFGTSRQISTGPSSGLAAVAASAVLAAAITGTENVAEFVAAITLASGVLFLLLAVFNMGWVAQFLSRAVVTGFLFGAAIDVVIGELPKLTGTSVSGANPFQELRSWFETLNNTNLATVVVGVVALGVVFGLRVVAPVGSGRPGARRGWAACNMGLRPRGTRRRARRPRAPWSTDPPASQPAADG